ncbi:protein inturned-like [Elysia marginata]|uniref:Protein inturned-like n=1 Tax=Elysia marginata TaxID=1093978 RepID=A0AAV4EI49_9GAST|nr:protein inturned-like [Elysia marginata]
MPVVHTVSDEGEVVEWDEVTNRLRCCVAKSTRQKRAPPWLGSVQQDGLFHLELPPGVESKLARLNSSDGSSISSLALGGGGCNSEDTGYSSDQDGRISPDGKLGCGLKPGSRRSNSKSRLKKNEKLSNIVTTSAGSQAQTLAKRYEKQSSSSSLSSSTSSSTIQEAEAQFDQLSLSSSSGVSSHCRLNNTTNSSFTDSVLRFSADDDNDDGICLNKSDLRSSKTSSTSAFSFQTSSSHFSSDSRGGAYKKSPSGSSKSYLRSSHRTSTKIPPSSRSSFAQNFKNPLRWKTSYVDIALPSGISEDNKKRERTEMCQRLLGIVPVWPEDVDPSHRGYRDVEVMVGSVVPGSPLSRVSQDVQGVWLHKVNEHVLTWDNMDAVLACLDSLRKARLTFKSMRPEKSSVDLEALVNILTSDAQNNDCLDNTAAMYISLDGVDPDDPSSSASDGVVYSFPSQISPLCQLQGLFYTLAHLVRDMTRQGSIKNTTILVDECTIHVAYLQEGSDILVLAIPASYLSVWQLNALLAEFSRLLRLLFGSVEAAFTRPNNRSTTSTTNHTFINTVLSYIFHQVVTAPLFPLPAPSSLLMSSLPPVGVSDKGEQNPLTEAKPFVRFSQHVPAMILPEDVSMMVEKSMSEFESSDFADMSEVYYGCRRQFNVLGSAFFYCGQLVSSHLAREDLRDLHLYVQSLGILDLSTRCSVAQLVAWREVHPTRQCHDIAEINNSFGYSEPNARWCLLIVGLKHGLFCCLLETVGPGPLRQAVLSPDVFYVEQAKACLLQLQTPQLVAAYNIRVSKESQSAVAKSDYCATYVHTNGEKTKLVFDDKGSRLEQWPLKVHESQSGCSQNLYRNPRRGKMYPIASDRDGLSNMSLTTDFINMPSLHKLSTTRHPAIYQYCCLDGMEGTVVTGSDRDTSASIFHGVVVQNFYRCCRDIHQFFRNHADNTISKSHYKDNDDEGYDNVTFDPHLRGMKEHGILMAFNPNQEDVSERKGQEVLEYWVVGRRIKRPSVREVFVCFHASASQSLIELAFRLGFGSMS